MPRLKKLVANLDSRFWEITEKKNSFEWVKIQSGFTFYLPFKKTKLWNKWADKGFKLSKSIRLAIKDGKLFIEFFFEKEAPPLKKEGDIEGLDLNYVNLAVCSDGQVVGEKMNEFIESFAKREKHTHKQITQKAFQELKKLDLGKIRVLIKVSPFKTSTFCRFCGNWDSRNRKGDKFRCLSCGHQDNADHNGAMNLKLLGLAGAYSLRWLKSSFRGNTCL